MTELVRIAPEGASGELAVRRARPDGARPDAPKVLYLHGFGSSQDGDKAELFRGRALAGGIEFVSLDFQGHGLSGGSMLGLTLSRCLEDVARVRGALEGLSEPVALIGSSLGGLVALWHAALSPDKGRGRVRAVAAIAPALGLDATMAEVLGEEGMERWQREGSLEITNELGTFEVGWDFVGDLAGYATAELGARCEVPALLFQGKLDDRVSWREVAAFAEATPRFTTLELFEDGDHRLLERMDAIVSESLAFVGGATSPAPST